MIFTLMKQEAVKLFTKSFVPLLFGLVTVLEAGVMIFNASNVKVSTLEAVTAPQMLGEGLTIGIRFGAWVVLIIAAMAFSQESSDGTIKTMLVMPIERYQWLVAKIAFLSVLAMLLVFSLSLVGIVVVAFFQGWGPVVRDGIEIFDAGLVWSMVFKMIGLTALFMLPVAGLGLMIGSFFKSSGPAVGVTMVTWLMLTTVGEMLPAKFVFSVYLEKPADLLVKLGKGLPFVWQSLATWGLGVALVSFCAFVFLVGFRFHNMDITD